MTMTGTTVLDGIRQSLLEAGRYNRDDKTKPAAVLWPDPDRLWEPVVELLRPQMRIATLGDFVPEVSTGPAIWIRCILAEAPTSGSDDDPWVIYLPGIERSELRAIESCAANIRPLAELQFRSAWWLQSNQSPWTTAGFLRSADGLELDLGRDNETLAALSLALPQVLGLAVQDLRNRGRIDGGYLSSLLVSDEIKTLLEWLNDPDGTKSRLQGNHWAAFLAQCKSSLGVDPESEGPLTVAQKLGGREGVWDKVWERFAEAPHSYPKIPEQLRRAKPAYQLFSDSPDAWPQDNEAAEAEVLAHFNKISTATPAEARERVVALEREHGRRRETVWGQLGQAPLAKALGYLCFIAEQTGKNASANSLPEIIEWYSTSGYRVDAAAISALAEADDARSRESVGEVLRAIYLPWIDDAARLFQGLVQAGNAHADTGLAMDEGDCVLFIDGLRLDVGESVRKALAERGANAEMGTRLAAFPTMTSSGKPAVAPIVAVLEPGEELTPTVKGRTVDAPTLRALLVEADVQTLTPDETGSPTGRAWTEAGDLDAAGHKLGLKIVDRIPQEVAEIASRVCELLDAGWQRVHIVTDHGWLLMPGQLPKVELPQHLTVTRKSRCARLIAGANPVDQPTFAWTWDKDVRIAVPRGVAAFEAGCIYEHGGLSPQESITPHMIVTAAATASVARIEAIKWIGLRCRVDYIDAPTGAKIDVRKSPGDPSSSIVPEPKILAGSGELKILVPDDSLEGAAAYVVILSDSGDILAQVATKVGD
jgi:hypothetical protein